MSVLVKICGITKLDDALVAIEAGADALGFNFFPPSPRYVEPETAAAIALALPKHIRRVGVFVNEFPTEITRIREMVGLDTIQLHGDEDPAHYEDLGPLWRAVRVDSQFRAGAIPPWPVEALVLDGPAGTLYGGAGIPFDWNAANGLPQRIIVAGGLGPENVAQAVRLSNPWGVDACSRLETSPGIKHHERIRAFVKAVRGTEHIA